MLETLQDQRREIRRVLETNQELRTAEASFSSGQEKVQQEMQQLREKKEALSEELKSLKVIFARRIAVDEEKVERQIREKDEECEKWLRSKKEEIEKMRNASVIMKRIFDIRRERFEEREEEQRRVFEEEKREWEIKAERERQELEREKQAALDEQHGLVGRYEDLLKLQERQQVEYQVKAEELERQLDQSRQESELLKEELQEANKHTEEISKKLAEMDKTQTMFASNTREEQLEAELRRLKRQAAKSGLKAEAEDEVEALKKEMMEYVHFILKLLPVSGSPGSPKSASMLPGMKNTTCIGSLNSTKGWNREKPTPAGMIGSNFGFSEGLVLPDCQGASVPSRHFRAGAAELFSPVRPTEPASFSSPSGPRRPTSRRSMDTLGFAN